MLVGWEDTVPSSPTSTSIPQIRPTTLDRYIPSRIQRTPRIRKHRDCITPIRQSIQYQPQRGLQARGPVAVREEGDLDFGEDGPRCQTIYEGQREEGEGFTAAVFEFAGPGFAPVVEGRGGGGRGWGGHGGLSGPHCSPFRGVPGTAGVFWVRSPGSQFAGVVVMIQE